MLASSTTDWITAIASAFAAVGTVGAVIVALWQTRRRGRYDVHVTCKLGITGDDEIGDLISLEGTNKGERMVKLMTAYLLTDDERTVVAKFSEPGLANITLVASLERSPLPESLIDGESVAVHWQLSTLESIKAKDGFSHYLCAYFTDPLGNIYAAAYPGVKTKRKLKGWRLRKEYVAPSK